MIDQKDSAPDLTTPVPAAKAAKKKRDKEEAPASAASATPPHETVPPPLNLLDLQKLRLSQDFSGMGVKKALLTVPVKKPTKEWWIQTSSDPEFRLDTAVVELKEEGETYLVRPELWSDLVTESTFSPRALITAVTSTGVCFLWPIRLPGPDGRIDEWNRSALEAASLAANGKWVRVQANRSLGAYDVTISEYCKPPVWPEISFNELVQRAFKAKYIDTLDHPVLKRLRGEM